MNWFGKSAAVAPAASAARAPVLVVENLSVYYGRAHALQGANLRIDSGVLGIVGRNGMGKTTLCNAITGLVPATGSIRFFGEEILGLMPNEVTRRGVAYVPQGRRVWPSLSVDETLRLVAPKRREVDRVYAMFPRLAERKSNGGAQLSGGEQQMLAIGRALLLQPKLLVMDEPTEGLAPVIVEQVAQALRDLAQRGDLAVLLIEQNLGVALSVSSRIGVMVNGCIAHEMATEQLASDRDLQERLLGLRSGGQEDPSVITAPVAAAEPAQMFTVLRAHSGGAQTPSSAAPSTVSGLNRWNAAQYPDDDAQALPGIARRAQALAAAEQPALPSSTAARIFDVPVAATSNRAAYVVGTFDTKSRELLFMRQCIEKLGLRVVTVDLSTSGKPSPASIHPREVARFHPEGEAAVFTGDRGSAVAGMATAFKHFVGSRRDVGGVISAGGSGGTSLVTSGMQALPIGMPKVMVSTMASGDTRPYVGASDICMMYSVTDVQGINRISEKVLANAAHALAGMITHPPTESAITKQALGLTMFGVTTPCVQAVARQLEESYDCLVFHATGVGGLSMEKLVESNLLVGVLDISTTEIADEICGGVQSAGPHRMDVFARHAVPYVGSCGALDMVNFGAWDSVPERYKTRNLYRHNPSVTLMRTSAEECERIGHFIAEKLNAMKGPVRFLMPEGGVSAIDKPGQPFYDEQANKLLFATLEKNFRPTAQHKLLRVPHHINDDAFAQALVAAWHDIASPAQSHKF